MKLICFLNSVYLTVTLAFYNWFVHGWSVSGHDYIEVDGELVCKRCGKVSK